MIVNDLAELKLYVVNKLVEIVQDEESNRKEQITALRSIGEVDGVDAFKKKTEVLHKVESIDEVEKELIKLLNEFKSQGLIKAEPQTIDAELVEEEVKEKSFDDIVQEAVDGSTTGD
jgi:glutamyl-tRNA reductase